MRREEDIITNVKALEQERLDLKSAQFISQRSIINYSTHSNNLYDYHFTIYTVDPLKEFYITFTHSIPTNKALLRLMVFGRVDDPDVMADPIPYNSPTAPALQIRWRKEVPSQVGVTVWKMYILKGQFGIPSYEAYLKFFVEGTDSGTLNVTAL